MRASRASLREAKVWYRVDAPQRQVNSELRVATGHYEVLRGMNVEKEKAP